jgi:hypothetical protein
VTVKETVAAFRNTVEILKGDRVTAYPENALFYITNTSREVLAVCRVKEFVELLDAAAIGAEL